MIAGRKSTEVPKFYHTGTKQQNNSRSSTSLPSYLENPKPNRTIPEPEGERFSKRVRGLMIEPAPTLEKVEKRFNRSSPVKEDGNKSKNIESDSNITSPIHDKDTKGEIQTSLKDCSKTPSSSSQKVKATPNSSSTANSKKKSASKSKCVWCKPKRKRPRLMFSRHHKGSPDEADKPDNITKEEKESETSVQNTLDTSKEENISKEKTSQPVGSCLELKIDINSKIFLLFSCIF